MWKHILKKSVPSTGSVDVSELDNLLNSMSPKSKDTTVERDLDDLRDIANSRRSRREQEKKNVKKTKELRVILMIYTT